MQKRRESMFQADKGLRTPLPVCKKSEHSLERPDPEDLLDRNIKEGLKSGKIKKIYNAADPSVNDSEESNFFGELLGNVSETMETVYDTARQKAVEWLESENGLSSAWKNVKEQLKRNKAMLEDYTTPIYKETGKAVKDVYAVLQDKFINRWK